MLTHTRFINCFCLFGSFCCFALHFSEVRSSTETTWKFCCTFFECKRLLSFVLDEVASANIVHVWIYVMIKTNFYMDEFESTFNIHDQLHRYSTYTCIYKWMNEWMSMHHYYRNSTPLTGVFEFIEKCVCAMCINLIKWCIPMRAYFTFLSIRKIEKYRWDGFGRVNGWFPFSFHALSMFLVSFISIILFLLSFSLFCVVSIAAVCL